MVEFIAEKITEHITRIITPFQVCVYFVTGSKKSVLIDTGFGLGSLKDFIEGISQQPYEVIVSHGHIDHAGGAGEFDKVYLNERDWELVKWHCSEELRLKEVFQDINMKQEGVEISDCIPLRVDDYTNIEECDSFELGGVDIQIIAVPGHSYGSLMFVIPQDRVCITGDALGEHTLLQFKDCAPITEYKEGLKHLASFEESFDIVLRNHGKFIADKRIIQDTIELCDEILERKDAAVPIIFHEVEGLMGRQEVHPGKYGNIVYNPDNLY